MEKRKKPSITPETCQYLLANLGWSQSKIYTTFSISSKTVSAISKGEYNPKKAGPKPKFNQVHIDYVLEIAFLNPRMSSATMAQKFKEKFTQLTISATKVREIIKENGFRYLSCRKIQDLNSNYIKE